MARGDFYTGIDPNARSSNPFRQALAAQRDPWSGMRSTGQMAQPAPAASPVQPTSQYNPILDPTGPFARTTRIGGLLSGLFGNGMTRQEMLAEKAGLATQQAFSAISQRIQGGMSQQQAMIDFVQSPQGVEFFRSGGGMTDLANIFKGIVPEAEEPMVLSPGQAAFSPSTGKQLFSQPTTEQQEFDFFANMGRLTDDQRAEVAKAQLLGQQTGDPTQSEAAFNRLIEQGLITRNEADLLLSGVKKIQPKLDAAGATTGWVVVDMRDGSVRELNSVPTGVGQTPQPGTPNYAPGITPGSTEPTDNTPVFQGMTNPADIVESAGVIGGVQEAIANTVGFAVPGLAFPDVIRNRRALESIRADANMIAKSGRVLATEMKDIRELVDTTKFFTNPIGAAQTLISLHDRYDNAEKILHEQMNDPNTTNEVRGEATMSMALLRRARANLPSRESLTQKLNDLQGREPFEDVNKAITRDTDEAGKALDSTGAADKVKGMVDGGEAPQQQFKSVEELNSAFEAGKVKVGDRVIVGGKPYRIGPKKDK